MLAVFGMFDVCTGYDLIQYITRNIAVYIASWVILQT